MQPLTSSPSPLLPRCSSCQLQGAHPGDAGAGAGELQVSPWSGRWHCRALPADVTAAANRVRVMPAVPSRPRQLLPLPATSKSPTLFTCNVDRSSLQEDRGHDAGPEAWLPRPGPGHLVSGIRLAELLTRLCHCTASPPPCKGPSSNKRIDMSQYQLVRSAPRQPACLLLLAGVLTAAGLLRLPRSPEYSTQGFHPTLWHTLTTTLDGPEVATFKQVGNN